MRTRGVVVGGVTGKDPVKMPLAEDQHAVGDLGPHGGTTATELRRVLAAGVSDAKRTLLASPVFTAPVQLAGSRRAGAVLCA
jgi:hypothetical protein